MVSRFKKSFEPIISIISLPFLSWNPSVLTFLSLVGSIFFFIGIVERVYWLSILSILGFLFDAIDGYVARKTGKVTKFGAFLDSTLDRVSDFFIIISFANLVNWGLVVLVAFTTFLISYMRARSDAEFGKHSNPKELMQRTERIIFIILSFFLYLIFPKLSFSNLSLLTVAFIILLILNIFTIFQRFWNIKSNGQK